MNPDKRSKYTIATTDPNIGNTRMIARMDPIIGGSGPTRGVLGCCGVYGTCVGRGDGSFVG